MRHTGSALVCLALLTACGPPEDEPRIRPSVNTNVALTPDGIRTSTGVSVRSGPVSLGVHL